MNLRKIALACTIISTPGTRRSAVANGYGIRSGRRNDPKSTLDRSIYRLRRAVTVLGRLSSGVERLAPQRSLPVYRCRWRTQLASD